jgi:undecaprenyl-diphosphatase
LCGTSETLDRIVYHLAGPTGVIFLGLFGLLWFRQNSLQIRRRQALILVIPAVALALIINRTISTLLPFRVRPMYALGANPPSYPWTFDLENWSSFPSDNASYLFAIAACLWVASRGAGLAFSLFSLLVCLGRVYFGIHYPSDVAAGALLGLAAGYVVTRPAIAESVSRPLLGYEKQVPAYFYALLFMMLAEVVGGFPNTRHVGVAIVHMFRNYDDVPARNPTAPAPVNTTPNANGGRTTSQ